MTKDLGTQMALNRTWSAEPANAAFRGLEPSDKDALLTQCIAHDPMSKELLERGRKIAEEYGVSDFIPKLIESIVPEGVVKLVEKYQSRLAYLGATVSRNIDPDILENSRRLNQDYVNACTWVKPPTEPLRAATPQESPIKAPEEEKLSSLIGSIELVVPGVAPQPRISPQCHLDSGYVGRRETALNESYGVAWSQKKIVRDILQNFYDGQGGSLAGVRMTVERSHRDGPFVVTIRGDGEFPHDLLVNIGGTTKSQDSESAGHFGEGGKLIPLLLLRSGTVTRCSYSSRDWQLDFEISKNEGGRSKLHFDVSQVKDSPGNSLRLESSDTRFISALCGGLDLFYYPGHPDFSTPHLQNRYGGISILPSGKRGNLYICGQRFEVDSSNSKGGDAQWKGELLECVVWSNRRLTNTGRDRIAIPIERVASKVIAPIIGAASNEQLISLLYGLKEHWQIPASIAAEEPVLLTPVLEEIRRRNLLTSFPEECQALPKRHARQVPKRVQEEGKIPCRAILGELGMSQRHETEFFEHITVVEMTKAEAERIAILRKGAERLLKYMLGNGILYAERPALEAIDPYLPVCVFEANRCKRLDGIDIPIAFHSGNFIAWHRECLNNSSFHSALTTHLHELTHAYGGDNTRVFTLEMSRWVQVALQTVSSEKMAHHLCALEFLWNRIDHDS
jgi:hypothetical protein